MTKQEALDVTKHTIDTNKGKIDDLISKTISYVKNYKPESDAIGIIFFDTLEKCIRNYDLYYDNIMKASEQKRAIEAIDN